jgi:hypothetical protein
MTDIAVNTSSEPRAKKKKRASKKAARKNRAKRLESWKKKAARLGVSTRTLDRWVTQGIIAPPEKINGRKYGDVDDEPVVPP